MNSTSQAAVGESGLVLRVGPWRIPDYLNSTPIIVDSGSNTLRRLDYHHWAEPLDKVIGRVVAERLSELLDTPRVAVYPDETSHREAYVLVYDVARFEGTLGGGVVLELSWEIREQATDKGIVARRGRYVIPPGSTQPTVAEYVAQLSEALEKWVSDVAQAMPRSK